MEMFWIAVAVIAIIIEFVTPSALVCIWFAVGALVAWVLSLLGLSLPIQVLAGLASSVLFLVVVRPIAMRYMRGNVVATNADRLVGTTGLVITRMDEDTWGEIKIQGSIWHAMNVEHAPIEVGVKVRVVAIEGAKLLVREIAD